MAWSGRHRHRLQAFPLLGRPAALGEPVERLGRPVAKEWNDRKEIASDALHHDADLTRRALGVSAPESDRESSAFLRHRHPSRLSAEGVGSRRGELSAGSVGELEVGFNQGLPPAVGKGILLWGVEARPDGHYLISQSFRGHASVTSFWQSFWLPSGVLLRKSCKHPV